MRRIPFALAAFSFLTAAAPPAHGDLVVRVENLRSAKGVVQLCVTANPGKFPDCKADPEARRASVAASAAAIVRFHGLSPGNYAISAIHDENANGKLDKLAMMPREGFGFSKNPPIRFGPPKFREARFTLPAGGGQQEVRMRYLL